MFVSTTLLRLFENGGALTGATTLGAIVGLIIALTVRCAMIHRNQQDSEGSEGTEQLQTKPIYDGGDDNVDLESGISPKETSLKLFELLKDGKSHPITEVLKELGVSANVGGQSFKKLIAELENDGFFEISDDGHQRLHHVSLPCSGFNRENRTALP